MSWLAAGCPYGRGADRDRTGDRAARAAAAPAAVASAAATDARPFRIARYPATLTERWALDDGREVTVRPVLPQDAPLTQAFVRSLSPESRYRRFHMGMGELPQRVLREFTELDYDRHLALVAADADEDGDETLVAEARFVRRDDAPLADFAVAVADDWQGLGLGRRLIAKLARSASRRGVRVLEGEVLADNARMIGLLRSMGTEFTSAPGEARVLVARLAAAGDGAGMRRPPLATRSPRSPALSAADAAAFSFGGEDERPEPISARVLAHLEG
jgi:acetyltransferase